MIENLEDFAKLPKLDFWGNLITFGANATFEAKPLEGESQSAGD